MSSGPVHVDLLPGPPADWQPGPGEPRLPRPPEPRLAPRSAYVVQRFVKPNWLNRRVGALVERLPLARRAFTVAERKSKEDLFGCRMCGQCALPVTG